MKRVFSIFLVCVFLLGLLPTAALAAEGDETYRYCDENGQNWQTGTKSSIDYTLVTADDTAWGAADSQEHWYVVSGNVTMGSSWRDAKCVTVTGNVHLILTDNSSLTINGSIVVSTGNSITIYAQSTKPETMGRLSVSASSATHYPVAIGNDYNTDCGNIIINGGNITATACNSGSGVGGKNGTVTINGGKVTAKGAGMRSTYSAWYYWCGAGIGGSGEYTGAAVKINGGQVTATGGLQSKDWDVWMAPGIGGGISHESSGESGTFSISGNAVLFTNAISDQSDKKNWHGVVFEGASGAVYGDVTLNEDLTIPSGYTLTIPEGVTLAVPNGVTLTVDGVIIGGGTISGGGTITCKTPNSGEGYTLSYADETATAQNGYEVSVNNSTWASTVSVTPSNPLYVRKAGCGVTSQGAENTIPDRPSAPTLTIDNAAESVTISSDYYYNTTGPDYTNTWTQGTGSAVTVAPGGSIYIYKAATSSSFKSAVLTLTAPSRGTPPSINIDYGTETLSTTGDMQYCVSTSGQSVPSWQTCTANMAAKAFGWNGSAAVTVQFRTKATDGTYAGEAQELTIPVRPAAPIVPLKFTKTANGITVTNTDSYSGCEFSIDNTNWNDDGIFTGLTAGQTYSVRVRTKAVTNTAFASTSQTVSVTTVNADGSTTVKPGESAETGSATITNDGEKIIITGEDGTTTTITPPTTGGDVNVGAGGGVTVPGGSTVQTGDNGPKITAGDKGGTVGSDGSITVPDGGTIQIGSDPATTITPANGEAVTPNEDGTVTIPGGSTVQTGDGQKTTVGGQGGKVASDGSIAVLEGSDVPYLFCDADGASWQTGKKNSNDCITITARTTAWNTGWYLASGDVTIDSRVTVTGEVHLILEDGCKLTVNGGIDVADGSGLTLYAQSTGDNIGVLTATADSSNAGIGGGGGVTINGGTVKATGGMGSKGWGGAGIGSGIRSSGGSITINGGNVTAAGNGTGAGLGSGTGGSGSTITINGGTVNATGGIDNDYNSGGGAGIGGNKNDTILISGGIVTAKGGADNMMGNFGGAGIGGNSSQAGGSITISGGIVTAIGGSRAAGIGGGGLTGSGGTVTISGGTVTATGDNGAAGIGGAAGMVDTQGTFSTGTNGNALIVASSIGDNDDKSDWSGMIFEGDSGVIYGDSVTLATDAAIPSGKTLEIGENQTLTIGAGTTLTVDGTVEIAGGGTLDLSDGGRLVVGNGGKVIVLENGTVKVGDTTVTLPDGGTVDDEGKITVPDGGTIQIGTDPVTTITPPTGGEVTPNPDGTVTVPDGSTVKAGDNGPEITVGDQGGTVSGDGSITVPENGTVTVKDDSGDTTVTMPGGGTVKPKTDGTVEVPGGAAVEKGGQTTTVPDGGGTLDPATGKVTQGGGSGGSGGSYTPPSKPSVSVNGGGGKVTSDRNGTVTITPDEGYQIEKITVNGKEVEIPADGKLTDLKPTDKVVVTFAEIFPRFTDIAPRAWYYDAVKYAVEHGLFYGTSDTTFSPNSTMTRGMLVTVLYRMESEPEADPADFLDVGSGKYYSEAVAWAAANGIVAGYGNGNFGPEDAITREQLAAILYRYSGSPASSGTLTGFTDADKASGYALDALCWAVEQGIIQGKGGGILDPAGKATRAEVAAMLQRFCEKAGR